MKQESQENWKMYTAGFPGYMRWVFQFLREAVSLHCKDNNQSR